MVGVEIDMIVKNSLEALATYEQVFDLDIVEKTDFAPGNNEAIFTLYGTRIHLLDENEAYGMTAPKEGDAKPMWLNILVPSIDDTFAKATAAGFTAIQPVTALEAMGVKNAVLVDAFGYIWMLHEIVKEISFEERLELVKEMHAEG